MAGATASEVAATPTQRIAAAIVRAQEAVPEATNAKLLEAILLELAVQSLMDTPARVVQIGDRYAAATTKPKAAGARGGKRTSKAVPKVSDFVEPLEPIKYVPDYEVKLGEAPDPYFLLDVFGAHQLERALKPRSVGDLRKAAAIVEQRHPGTMPTGKVTKPGWIAYIVQYVAGAEATVQPTR